jgi:CHAT domain-containing protein
MKRLLPRAQILMDQQATKAALQRVAGPKILHIATHGFFLPDLPTTAPRALGMRGGVQPDLSSDNSPVRGENLLVRSGIALAGANRTGEGRGEGILTALEATQLDLWGTELVVLSACDTGIGQVSNGDGVYGLQRALVLAGARSQIISLWKVNDAATKDLMLGFYGRVLDLKACRSAEAGATQDAVKQHARAPVLLGGFHLFGRRRCAARGGALK